MGTLPRTRLKLLKDVPLDNSYQDTLYFPNKTEQANHFINGNYGQKDFFDYMYQRVNKNTIRIKVKADDIYSYNYIMFKNEAHGNKWFYAFITSIEYINEETSEITYEIDDMQTYFYDLTLKPCFVEREHSVTDNIGDNIIPEPVELGEYVHSDWDTLINATGQFSNNMRPVILIMVVNEDEPTVESKVYDNIFSGCTIYAFDSLDDDYAEQISNFLSGYIQRPEQIVAIYTAPYCLFGTITQGQPLPSQTAIENDYRLPSLKTNGQLKPFAGTFTPKNKKLYTYPYNFVRINNADGQALDLRYEFFKDQFPIVRINSCITMPVKMILYPINYKGIDLSETNRNKMVTDECISLEGFPLCSWNVDTFKAWIAQNAVQLGTKVASGVAVGVATQNPIAMGSAVGLLGSALLQGYTASIQADQFKGSTNNGSPNMAHNTMNFYTTRTHITIAYARTIDDFFSTYGYQTNRIKIPNTHSRPHWNYVKTHNAVLVGDAPSSATSHIRDLFNKGITFWKHANEVGNYGLDNSP